MRILFGRDDGFEYLFLRQGAPLCLSAVHQEQLRMRFARLEDAASLLRWLAHSPGTHAALRSLLPTYAGSTRLSPSAVLRRLAQLLWIGAVVVHRRRYARTAYFLEYAAGSSAPPPPPPTPRPTQIEERDTFPPTHDAAAQANALKGAAQAGVPFCEECARP